MSKVQKWLTVTAVTLLILTQFLFLAPNPAFACSCAPPDSVESERDMATAVFAGEVTQIDVPGGVVISSADPVQVTFNVSQVWKGPQQATIVITTAREDASCGYGFEVGQEYLVYAGRNNDKMEVSLCSRTNLLANAANDLAILGAGVIPSTSPTLEVDSPTSTFLVVLVALLLLIALLTAVSVLKRRKS